MHACMHVLITLAHSASTVFSSCVFSSFDDLVHFRKINVHVACRGAPPQISRSFWTLAVLFCLFVASFASTDQETDRLLSVHAEWSLGSIRPT
eukprot:m.182130 g.182130  ORF g.182130 m.182130 type:complete len:93 (+) comp39287_c0_seq2:3039-3317(+)